MENIYESQEKPMPKILKEKLLIAFCNVSQEVQGKAAKRNQISWVLVPYLSSLIRMNNAKGLLAKTLYKVTWKGSHGQRDQHKNMPVQLHIS